MQWEINVIILRRHHNVAATQGGAAQTQATWAKIVSMIVHVRHVGHVGRHGRKVKSEVEVKTV